MGVRVDGRERIGPIQGSMPFLPWHCLTRSEGARVVIGTFSLRGVGLKVPRKSEGTFTTIRRVPKTEYFTSVIKCSNWVQNTVFTRLVFRFFFFFFFRELVDGTI